MVLPGAPPFAEHDSVIKIRETARRLATTRLPLFVVGASGTGRRSLAHAIAQLRAGDSSRIEEVHPHEMDHAGAESVLVLAHPELLPRTAQVGAALRIKRGQQIVMWGDPSFVDDCVPELRAHSIAGLLALPTLAERGDDALRWAEFFLESTHSNIKLSFSASARECLAAHVWRGNLAELRAVITRAVALLDVSKTQEISPQELGLATTTLDAVVDTLAVAVEAFRRDYILRALAACDGNRTRTARLLGVDARTIFRYLERNSDE